MRYVSISVNLFLGRASVCFGLADWRANFSPFLACWSRGSDREGNYDLFIRIVGIGSPRYWAWNLWADISSFRNRSPSSARGHWTFLDITLRWHIRRNGLDPFWGLYPR